MDLTHGTSFYHKLCQQFIQNNEFKLCISK